VLQQAPVAQKRKERLVSYKYLTILKLSMLSDL